MEGILEGLLYVQGDLGITLEQICDILEIDENKAKELVYSLKVSYEQNNRGLSYWLDLLFRNLLVK